MVLWRIGIWMRVVDHGAGFNHVPRSFEGGGAVCEASGADGHPIHLGGAAGAASAARARLPSGVGL